MKKEKKREKKASSRHFAWRAQAPECIKPTEMLAPGSHQGHLKPPFSFLISMAQLLPHSTVTRASEDLTSTGHPEGKRRKGSEDKS